MFDDQNYIADSAHFRVIWGQREGFATKYEAVHAADYTGAVLVLNSQDRVIWKDYPGCTAPPWCPIEETAKRDASRRYAVVWLFEDAFSEMQDEAIAWAEKDDALLVVGPHNRVVWTNPDGCWILPSSKVIAWDLEVIPLTDRCAVN